MNRNASRALLRERLLSLLSRIGPASASQLTIELGISPQTLSRLVRSLRGQVLSFGRARATRYFVPRNIPHVRQPVPLYEVRPRGERLRRVGELRATGDRGILVAFGESENHFFRDLPWFLQSMRPSGFLGRLVPQRYPELEFPTDIRLWSGDQVLRFASRVGWDLPGAFIVGEDACTRFLEEIERPSNIVDAAERTVRYPAIAQDLLSFGLGGSSAAGEQPKFLATRCVEDRLSPVLVKFSPTSDESLGRRVADLLVAEHVALLVASEFGFVAPVSCILTGGGRVFLEVERFDRDGIEHRIGQVSLESLDAEFAGTDLKSWTVSAETLAERGVVPMDVLPQVRWLETFGHLIGNTDMHFGNLAFLMDRIRVTSLSPVYDMVPMHYHPRQGDLPVVDHSLPILGPEVADVAASALTAAIDFWTRLADDDRVSENFRKIATRSITRTNGLRPRVDALPVTTTRRTRHS